jgi:hypothetical protein
LSIGTSYKPLNLVLKNLFPILGIYIRECLAIKKILPFKKSIALLASNIFKAECAMKKIKFEREKGIKTPHSSPLVPISQACGTFSLIGYSFWFYDCIYLAWMRKKGWIGKAVSRAHTEATYLRIDSSLRNGKILIP